MRASGAFVAPPVDAGAHACWRFDDHSDFRDAAVRYLADGVARRERVVYVADRRTDVMRSEVSPLGDVDRLVGAGDLVLQPVRELYEPGGVFDGARQVGAYRDLVARALRDGYRGLRVAADATALVAGEAARRRFVQYELAIDRVISTEPMSALCAYDGRALGRAVTELFAVHPLHHGAEGGEPGFQAYYDAGCLRLSGEVDLANREVFTLVLEAAGSSDDREVVVDLSELEFIDVRGLALLSQLATRLRTSDRSLRVGGAAPIVRRCCDLLDLDAVMPREVAP